MDLVPVLFVVSLFVLLLFVGIFIHIKWNQPKESSILQPEGHWTGIGLIIGMPVGIALALAMGYFIDNISLFFAVGPAIGVGVGIAIGSWLEMRNKSHTRPLTKAEKAAEHKVMRLAILVQLFGLVVFAALYMMGEFRF